MKKIIEKLGRGLLWLLTAVGTILLRITTGLLFALVPNRVRKNKHLTKI